MTSSSEFRPDINALRALAVLAVTLYHFDIPGFGGGFIGVDIFFVISGFLMSKIVLDAHEKGRFSVRVFYWARAKRIVPALVALCFALLVLGYFTLLPSDYKMLAKHAGGSLGFISNWIYYTESGYFDHASHDKWLLHTWSLSVEWQFYMLFPLLMAAMLKFIHQRYWLYLFSAATLLTCILSIYLSHENPSAAFYLLPSRAYELLAGGVVSLLTRNDRVARHDWGQWGSLIGLAFIFTSLLVFNSRSVWPGIASTLPVAGTVLVIHAKSSATPLTKNKAIQSIGLWSYSIYLWHWPVNVALGYIAINHQPVWKVSGVALAVLLGALSYHLVETPSRRTFAMIQRTTGIFLTVLITLTCGALAITVYVCEGMVKRAIPDAALLADKEKENNQRHASNRQPCEQPTDGLLHPCVYGKGPIGSIVIGDSHSAALVTAVEESLAPRNQSVVHWGFNACPTTISVKHDNRKFSACAQFNENVLNGLSHMYPGVPVIVINRWASYLEGPGEHEQDAGIRFISFRNGETDQEFRTNFENALTNSLCGIAEAGHKVLIVSPVAEMPYNVPNHISRASMLSGAVREASLPVSAYQQRNRNTLNMLNRVGKRCKANILDPSAYLCDSDKCYGSINGRPLYTDDNHLSEFGNKILVPMFRNSFPN